MKVFEATIGVKGSKLDGGNDDNWKKKTITAKNFDEALRKVRSRLQKKEYISSLVKKMDLDD